MKTGIITQARMTSKRLPGKVLMNINGTSILDYQINRLQNSESEIFIATTTNSTDNPIIEVANKRNISYYRGNEQNVLSRFYECAVKYKLDIIVRVTSDCPLIDGDIIRDAINKYIEMDNNKVYLSNYIERTYPRGFDFEVFSFELLEEAFKHAYSDYDKEHVTPYIRNNHLGSTIFSHMIHHADKSQYRITLDTAEDFELIKRLIEDYHCQNKSADEIITILDVHPELVKINAHIEQKK